MWVAFLVALVITANGPQIGVLSAPGVFHSEAECKATQEGVEAQLKESPTIKGYVLKCVKVDESEIKANGKDA